MILEGKPDTAEKIAHGSAEHHAAQAQVPFIEPFINKKSRNQRHKNKADEIAAGGTEKLCGSAGEIREYGKSHKPEQQINQVAEGSLFHAKHKNGKAERQIGKGDGNRCKGQRNGNRSQNTSDGCHETDKRHRLDI